MVFKIHGIIKDKETGKGIPNLTVKAIDKDLFFDDLLGSVTTDENGKFEIIYDKEDFQELFFDKKPDLYLTIKDSKGRIILTTEDKVRYGASDTESFQIKMDSGQLMQTLSEEEISRMADVIVERLQQAACPTNIFCDTPPP